MAQKIKRKKKAIASVHELAQCKSLKFAVKKKYDMMELYRDIRIFKEM